MSILGLICVVMGIWTVFIGAPLFIATEGSMKFIFDKIASNDIKVRIGAIFTVSLALGLIVFSRNYNSLPEIFVYCWGWLTVFIFVWSIFIPSILRKFWEYLQSDANALILRLGGISYLFWGSLFIYLGLVVL